MRCSRLFAATFLLLPPWWAGCSATPVDHGGDGGLIDGGGPDEGQQDAGPQDAGPQDAGPQDAGPQDSGPGDSGPPPSSIADWWMPFGGDFDPSNRCCHAMAFDSAREVAVLFGGQDGQMNLLQDTWQWDGAQWLWQLSTNSPPPRSYHAMAYDSTRAVTVLYGGMVDTMPDGWSNDTWEWNGTTWEQVGLCSDSICSNTPGARYGHAMAFDVARNVTVLFGGSGPNDTWEWNGTVWTQRSPATSPVGRQGLAMAYDGSRGVTVMFGGATGSGILNDTWEWDGADWVQRIENGSPGSPAARWYHAIAYDSSRHLTVLYGGLPGGYDDTWEWNGATWNETFPSASPPGLASTAMAFDSARGTTIICGGNDGEPTDGTWEYGTPGERPPDAGMPDAGTPTGQGSDGGVPDSGG